MNPGQSRDAGRLPVRPGPAGSSRGWEPASVREADRRRVLAPIALLLDLEPGVDGPDDRLDWRLPTVPRAGVQTPTRRTTPRQAAPPVRFGSVAPAPPARVRSTAKIDKGVTAAQSLGCKAFLAAVSAAVRSTPSAHGGSARREQRYVSGPARAGPERRDAPLTFASAPALVRRPRPRTVSSCQAPGHSPRELARGRRGSRAGLRSQSRSRVWVLS